MHRIITVFVILALAGCASESEDPQHIIDQSILMAGGDNYDNTEIEFLFRGREYGYKKTNGSYEYVRLFKDSTGIIRDVLTNNEFIREIDGKKANIPDSMARKYTNSVNSVIYFALLPYGLNDPAVNKKYLGKKTMNGKNYHKIGVTFIEEGGGEDFEDVFVYWINAENHKVDYLAYKYQTDGGGMRFREAYNERFVGGVRFVDYVNYKAPKTGVPETLDDAFLNNELEELSRIELEDIKVNKL